MPRPGGHRLNAVLFRKATKIASAPANVPTTANGSSNRSSSVTS
jgi:hypothetical protein